MEVANRKGRALVTGAPTPKIQPIYARYVVWRGLAEEAEIPRDAHAAVFNGVAGIVHWVQ